MADKASDMRAAVRTLTGIPTCVAAALTEIRRLCGACRNEGDGATPDECSACGETHFWCFAVEPNRSLSTLYNQFRRRMADRLRRTLH